MKITSSSIGGTSRILLGIMLLAMINARMLSSWRQSQAHKATPVTVSAPAHPSLSIAWLGVEVSDPEPGEVPASAHGALITSVHAGSPAALAGLHERDLITDLQGVSVSGAYALSHLPLQPGGPELVGVLRDGQMQWVSVSPEGTSRGSL
jgi:S1-C subfamily serine protease